MFSMDILSSFEVKCTIFLLLTGTFCLLMMNNRKKISETAISVNYHFTRQCNYQCKFCFHTAKTSFVLPLEEAKRGLKKLHDAGMKKINFSGGEPFIVNRGKFVGELVKYSKKNLKIESVTIVSNGSLINEKWFEDYGKYLDILAISCDSYKEETLKKIGRFANRTEHLKQLQSISHLCKSYQIKFKINTVVCSENWQEDMSELINIIKPARWKVFQCLLIDGENVGANALRDAKEMAIDSHQFNHFCNTHKGIKCLVPESNELMRNSYLILDEYMRFLNNVNGKKEPGYSILDIEMSEALGKSGFDRKVFYKRGGKYKWSKGDNTDW